MVSLPPILPCPAVIPVPWHLSIGMFIGILGFLGVVVPLVRNEMGKKEKAFWVAVLALLLYFELRSINLDQIQAKRETEFAQCENQRRFDESARENQQQFDSTMKEVGKVFDKTSDAANTAKDAVNTITGGNGFCYFTMGPYFIKNAPPPDKTNINLTTTGNRYLRQVTVRVVDTNAYIRDKTPLTDPVEFLNRHARTLALGDLKEGTGPLFQDFGINTDNHTDKNYTIEFSALNGQWRENMRYKYIDGKMEEAIRVTRLDYPTADVRKMQERVIFTTVSKGYPRVNGKVAWNAYP